MIDRELQTRLETLFAPLGETIVLSMRPSAHPRQSELAEMLGDLARASTRIELREEGEPSELPEFVVQKGPSPTGIVFRCVPGGHEFSSLVLAVLNVAGLGRLPDEALAARVAALKGPLELRTYVALSCTNCPDVVQALDQMAIIHGGLRHVVVDGDLVPEEVRRLGIQGVPAVFAGDELVHSGRSDFGSLLETLEARFGVASPPDASPAREGAIAGKAPPRADYDVVVLGGGPAGAAAAVYSARKGLRTALVAQRVGGQVNDTLAITNLISVPRTEGPRLAADIRSHLEDYPIDLFENRRVEEVEDGAAKLVRVAGGEVFGAAALIVATGAHWRELGIPGEREYLGRGVAFCPHCDGPFFAGKRVAVIGGGNSGVEAAIDLAGVCSRVTLFEFADALRADRVLIAALGKRPNIEVVTEARTTEIVGDGSSVRALRWENRATGEVSELPLEGVFVQIGLVPNSAVLSKVVKTNRAGEIEVDDHCRTSAPGIYAAGDVTTVPYKQIVVALGEGTKAALSAFEDRLVGVTKLMDGGKEREVIPL